jgi:predicted tellurium resistance membrane protein TerC
LGALLGFVALKMLTARWINVSITLSLAVIGAILAVCAVVSWLAKGSDQGSGNRDQGTGSGA